MKKKTKLVIWKTTNNLLLSGKLFNKLTIHEICEASSIHRSTFYRLFLDKYDLLEFGIDYSWQNYFTCFTPKQAQTPFVTTENFFTHSEAKKLVNSQQDDLTLLKEIKKITLRNLENSYANFLNTDDKQLVAGYIVMSIDYIDNVEKKKHQKLTAVEKDMLFSTLVLENPNIKKIFVDG